MAASEPTADEYVTCRLCGAEFRAVSASHLMLIHQTTPVAYKRRFGVEYLCAPATRWKISRAQHRAARLNTYKPRGRSEVLADLRALAQRTSPLTGVYFSKALMAEDAALVTQASRLFGSFPAACRKAGLTQGRDAMMQRRAMRGRVRRLLLRQGSDDERTARKLDPALVKAARRTWGSWRETLRSCSFRVAGQKAPRAALKLDLYATKWSRASVARVLARLARRYGALTSALLARHAASLAGVVNLLYGSLEQAARTLQLPFKRLRKSKWHKAEVLQALQARVKRGQTLQPCPVQRTASKLYLAAVHQFGSWELALRAGGIDYHSVLKPRKPRGLGDMRRDLRAWIRQHGPLCYAKLRDTAPDLAVAVNSCHGSLERLAQQLNLPYRPQLRSWTTAQVLQRLRELQKAGVPMTCNAIFAQDHGVVRAAIRRFGTWRKALAAL